MGTHERNLNRGECLEPTAVALLGKPLDFIHEDHLRERQICTMIDVIAKGTAMSGTTLDDVLGFLTTELPLHLRDEEEDLFPLLRRRCEPEDEISKVIAKLNKEHAEGDDNTAQVVTLLQALAEHPRPLDAAEKDMLSSYVSHTRRHLILENAIILPFARLRLTEEDLNTLYIRMCQRRGIESLKGAGDAQGPA